MTQLMPLKKVVVEITHQAEPDDYEAIRKAVKSWHNRLALGSIPRNVVTKLGRELFLDLDAWEQWLARRRSEQLPSGRGRPRKA